MFSRSLNTIFRSHYFICKGGIQLFLCYINSISIPTWSIWGREWRWVRLCNSVERYDRTLRAVDFVAETDAKLWTGYGSSSHLPIIKCSWIPLLKLLVEHEKLSAYFSLTNLFNICDGPSFGSIVVFWSPNFHRNNRQIQSSSQRADWWKIWASILYRNLLLSITSRPALGHTQPHFQCVSVAGSQWIKR